MKMSLRNDDELETLRQELNAAKTRAAVAEVRVGTVEAFVETLVERAEAAKERVGAAEAFVEALVERIEAAEERVGAAEALIGALVKRVEAAEERVGAAEERSNNIDFSIFLELCHNLLSKDLLV